MIHAVENEHNGEFDSNVMYITPRRAARKRCLSAAPAAELYRRQNAAGLRPDDFEVDFDGRATADLLTPLGKTQLGMG